MIFSIAANRLRRAAAMVAASAVALLLASAGLAPSFAGASTVTLGPALPTATGISEGCAFEHPDCAYLNSALPAGLVAKARASGTITSWRAEGFKGTGRLLIWKAAGGGRYSIVARSAPQKKKCITNSFGCFAPAGGLVYTFKTSLRIAAGEYIGIELISPANCNQTPDDGTCASVGLFDGFAGTPFKATNKNFDPTPGVGAASAPHQVGSGEMTVNATEKLGASKKPKHKPKHKPKPKAKRCVVPRLAGHKLAAAKTALRRARCKLGKVGQQKSSKVGKGRVISSAPKSGSKRKGGTAVPLTVSSGKAKSKTKAFDITGTWGVYSGPYTQYDTVAMNKKTGTFSGPGTATNGTGYTWPSHGTVKGSKVHWVFGPYNQLKTYTATCDGTVSAKGRKITGHCTDTFGHSLAWVMTRGPKAA